MLEARSVAVVGASVKPLSLGNQMVVELQRGGYEGSIYPVNPGYEDVLGLRCYPSIAELPEPVDLAILGVSNARVEQALRDAVAAGARSAVTFSSLFEEEPPADGSGAARAARRDRARGGHRDVRRQRHGVPEPGHRPARHRVRDARRHARRTGDLHLALGVGVRRGGVQRPRHRVQPDRVERSGDRLDHGRLHGVRPGTGVHAGAGAAARDRARSAAVPRAAPASGRGRHPGGGVDGGSHRGFQGDGDRPLRGAGGRARRVRSGVRRLRRARGATLDEMADAMELFSSPRRVRGSARGIASRARFGRGACLVRGPGHDLGVPFAAITEQTRAAIDDTLDPGLEATNPLDAWGTGIDADRIFRESFLVLHEDPTPPRWRSWSTSRGRASRTTRATCRSPRTCSRRPRSRSASCRTSRARWPWKRRRYLRDAGIPVLEGRARGWWRCGH